MFIKDCKEIILRETNNWIIIATNNFIIRYLTDIKNVLIAVDSTKPTPVGNKNE